MCDHVFLKRSWIPNTTCTYTTRTSLLGLVRHLSQYFHVWCFVLYVRTHQSSFCKSHSGLSLFALHTKLTSSLESHEILIHTRSTLRGRATYQKHYPSCIKCIAHIAAADLSVSRETIINEALWFHFPGLEREETPGFPWLWELLSGAGSTSCFLRRVSVIWMFGSCRLSDGVVEQQVSCLEL